MMNKQNKRIIPIAPPLIEMMDLVSTDDELDYLISIGRDWFTYKKAAAESRMSDEKFPKFFDTIKRKGFVYIEYDESGHELYRLNAIAVGWYEVIIYYLKEKPQEKVFSEKWNEYFKFFLKFNFFPLRNLHSAPQETTFWLFYLPINAREHRLSLGFRPEIKDLDILIAH